MPDDALIAVKPEIAAKASVTAERHRAMSDEAAARPRGLLARRDAARRLDEGADEDQERGLHRRRLHQMVRGRRAQRLRLLPRPPPRRRQRRPASRSSGKATTRTATAKVTYRELHERVCRLANAMRGLGVKKGDRVCIYLPMIVEAAVAMLACARIGAVHSIVFGGFSPDSLASRIQDSECALLLTADEGRRGGRKRAAQGQRRRGAEDLPLDQARDRRAATPAATVAMQAGRDHWWDDACGSPARDLRAGADGRGGPALHPLHQRLAPASPRACCTPPAATWSGPASPTSWSSTTSPGEIYWCTADVGWVTGHTYIVYGPLANGATTPDVRGRAQLPRHRPLLAGGGQAPGQHLLHRAHRHPRADARRRGAGEEAQPRSRCACSARSASRSTRKPGCGTTAWSATSAARSSTPGGRPRPAAS